MATNRIHGTYRACVWRHWERAGSDGRMSCVASLSTCWRVSADGWDAVGGGLERSNQPRSWRPVWEPGWKRPHSSQGIWGWMMNCCHGGSRRTPKQCCKTMDWYCSSSLECSRTQPALTTLLLQIILPFIPGVLSPSYRAPHFFFIT